MINKQKKKKDVMYQFIFLLLIINMINVFLDIVLTFYYFFLRPVLVSRHPIRPTF